MATTPGQRFVRRQNAARTTTSNTTAADVTYDTAVFTEGGYSYSSPEVTVDESGLYLTIFDLGQCDLASTRAVGTLVPSVNATDQTAYRATHRYLRNSGGAQQGASIGMAVLDLSASDDVKVRNPGVLTPTDSLGSYATNASYGGALQMLLLPDGNLTHLERTVDAAEVGTSNINTTRPWLDSSGTWTTITYDSEVQDDDSLYSGSGGDVTLAANKKYLVVWGATIYSADASRHTNVVRLQIGGVNVQSVSAYQRNTGSQGPPMCGMYLHETGGSAENLVIQSTHETEGGDAGIPQVSDAYLQVVELPDSAEWIHVDNGTTDSLTTALAGTTTWYDTPLSSTLRADGDSNLSLDSGNDAVQNDSGGSLPVLAIGWHRWDRDTISSGVRKNPWTRWDNGGSAVGYGVAGSYSRGQQSTDDTWQAHYVSAVTMDLANGADLSFQANDEASGANSDMGIYSGTAGNRYFLGVQVLNLESLDAGGTDALLANDAESGPEVASPAVGQEHGLSSGGVEAASEVTIPGLAITGHSLAADDVESASSATSPAIGHYEAEFIAVTLTDGGDELLADDVESATEVTSPTLGQAHALLADDVESLSEVTAPAVSEDSGLLADDVESASEAISPVIGQTHALLAADVESISEATSPAVAETTDLLAEEVESASDVSSPDLGQAHTLLADDAVSASSVTSPDAGHYEAEFIAVTLESGVTDDLLADDVESATEVSTPALGQVHGLLADDTESSSGVSSPSIVQDHALIADEAESSAEVSTPSIGQEHALTADYVESSSEVSLPGLSQAQALTADDVESASEAGQPGIGQEHDLLADDAESASQVSTPSLVDSGSLVDNLLADDVESISEASTPGVGQGHSLTADDTESTSEVSAPQLAQVHQLFADSAESGSEVSTPILSQGYQLTADSAESATEVSAPALAQVHQLVPVHSESASEVSSPALAQVYQLFADDVESRTEVSAPSLGGLAIGSLVATVEIYPAMTGEVSTQPYVTGLIATQAALSGSVESSPLITGGIELLPLLGGEIETL